MSLIEMMREMDPLVNVSWAPGMTLEEMEKLCICKAYRFFAQNKTKTSIALGISIRTLEIRLKKYEDDYTRFKDEAALERKRRAEASDRLRGVEFTKLNAVGSPNQLKPLLQRPAEDVKHPVENGVETSAGVRTEPPAPASAQHPLSVPQREEVQSVLPKHSAANGNRKRG